MNNCGTAFPLFVLQPGPAWRFSAPRSRDRREIGRHYNWFCYR